MNNRHPLSTGQRFWKRTFDLVVACILLLLLFPVLIAAFIIATVDTRTWGLFLQQRVGRNGRRFKLVKLRTMRPVAGVDTFVTTRRDPRITPVGRILRRFKIDELPQLWNVIRGEMSLVGPRPDVPGFADRLRGEDRLVLLVRPGVTGLASLHFRDEEMLLSRQRNPERYNREVIYPEKVRLNLKYIREYSFWLDLRLILNTLLQRTYNVPKPAVPVGSASGGERDCVY